MIGQASLLVTLVLLVYRLPLPPPPAKRGRGRPVTCPDQLFLKALVLMIVRHLHKVHELLTVLGQPTAEMRQVRALLALPDGPFPARRTWERRLAALPETLPAQIASLGRHLVGLLRPWADCGRAAAIDSTVLRALGGVWHKKDREAGKVPHTSIDTEAHWTKSGWHGWVYGWKLHLVTTVAGVWLPLAAELTPANAADSEVAPLLLAVLPAEVRFVLGDHQYGAPNVRAACDDAGRVLVAAREGGYPTPTTAWRSGACSTSCALRRSRTSTSNSSPASMPMARSPRAASPPPNASPSARSSSTNSCSGTATSAASTFASASNPASRPMTKPHLIYAMCDFRGLSW
jgi:hypothetical protein